jgi:D-threo-aldose 1-dehydrogenase
VHDPDDHLEDALAGAFPALARLRDQKVIGAIGAGMNQSAMLTRFVRDGLVDCVLIAGRYTLLDQSAASDLFPACERAAVDVVAAGVFNSGVLADPKPGARYDYVPASGALVDQAEAMARACDEFEVPLRAAAMQFSAGHPAVTTLLLGMRTAAEVEQNVADFVHPIPDALWDRLSVTRRGQNE